MQSCITVIGERDVVLGFRLLGITNTIVAEGKDLVKKFMEEFENPHCSVIVVSEHLKNMIDKKTLRSIEVSSKPLVVFIPLPGFKEEESIETMAKRILGIDIGSV
ncbi:H+-transporting ATP synthase subunit F [Thermoplasma volcanium GSS1]|uniref:A-type ATP synthase subunit F n=1 Tax=Thermoplasma volcanium (strain ATCC 51530 / DSM 4299 / JCM 9571 / NBRC 15438 / GSS1) TaxID=273116 RepID=AATF_THEVO|nr:V-type ATP synthase subunit F [Thermoplasma volcanium]Q97CQ1.1 RecName: Full=V-type ATP synthase subunit F; AltName: Full=V-ATPase subunit F [Thermoplasma volcanium GSS1]BAB59192.1 H+-transporting ATP synthase subunit F [Thermoplasma volcanium GSS1]